ncbi:MAG: tetratricopeptide repeat protein, partial [Myxococcota bacterium]
FVFDAFVFDAFVFDAFVFDAFVFDASQPTPAHGADEHAAAGDAEPRRPMGLTMGPWGMAVRVTVALMVLAWPKLGVAQTSDQALALGVAQRAQERYEAGDFERAAVLLGEAIDLHETPALHYNLARTLNQMDRWEEARAEYRTYLRLDPTAANRSSVEARIRELDERIERRREALPSDAPVDAAAAGSAELVTDSAVRGAPSSSSVNPIPWLVAGVGAAALVAAIPFAVLSRDAIDEARTSESHLEAVNPASDAETFTTTANVLFIVGGAIAAAGAVWGLIDLLATDDGPRATVSLGLDRIAVTGEF